MAREIRSNSKTGELQHTEQTVRKYHPYKLILSFSLVGISALFIAVIVAAMATATPDWQNLSLPQAFVISTFFIVCCSISLQLSTIAYQKDKTTQLRLLLGMTFCGGLAFIISQAVGWEVLRNQGILFENSASGSYVYLISGLHALHVMGGLIFFGFFAYDAEKYLKHPATALVFLTDPVKKLRLELVTLYWHFMDAVWLAIFLFFVMNLL